MTKKILLCFCFVQWITQAHADDLLQIYDLALQEDPQIHEAEASRNAIQEARPQSLARLLPTLAIVGTLNQNRFDTTNTFTNAQVGVQNFWDSSVYLKLSQPIYHHEYWVQLSQADNQLAQAEAEYAAEQQDLFVRTSKAYFGVLSARDNLEFANSERQALERQLQQIKKRFEVGTAAITDLREAQAGYDLSLAGEIAAKRTLNVAKAALREIIGKSDIELNPLREELPLHEPTPAGQKEWSELAQQHNLAIIAAENRAEIARKTIDLQFSGHLPTLDLVGNVGIADTDRPAGLVANSQTIGVQLNVPIFQGGGTSSRVRQARDQFAAAKENVDKQRRGVDRQVQDAYDGIGFSISQVHALGAAVSSSKAALDAAEAGLRVGTRTMVDVLTTQRNLYRAKRDFAQARYDYINNSFLLKQATGSLSRTDLEAVNAWLH
ncbi:TolC family outer membrane protein [Methylococcus sp. EFPC2]|uniref:TolC family outer membrane protein n=1 Tax=Methylococcus sp. EFPC2 TaxID=2812648 RepID=UPI0019680084|nr:TolC family outer membrane protein [Methylococcus sp. EFPC2]QSA98352.1 TolC family outer membrane protein [Methylococcus sp. EFPC2]